MIRLVLIMALLVALFFAARTLWRGLAKRDIDWSGVTFAVGFVALAFYLRHATGMG